MTEVELHAPWDKLDLSSHDAAKIYASVGASSSSSPCGTIFATASPTESPLASLNW